MKLVSGIVDSGFFAQSALSAEVATKDSLGRNISETYLTGVDLTPYQTIEGMTAYQSAGDYQPSGDYYSASNPSGFLVADDITGKLDASVYATDSGSFLTAVPDTYLQNTDLSTTDGKVTAISGIPLSAGGDVPEGVMVESGLEYNAVQEISGYNGSAIAQYGAEKQWLVTDDTLLTLSNSAQFALGVNISAVAQLLGVDETVLYTGNTAVTAFTASEPFTNFKEVAFYVAPNYETTVSKIVLPMVGYNTSHMALTYHSVWNGFKGGIQISTEYNNTGMSAFQLISGAWFGWANDAAKTGTYNDAWIHKIIGIGRKS